MDYPRLPRHLRELELPTTRKRIEEIREELYEFQNRRCAICNKQKELKEMVLDHDHYTKFIRGLLCYPCNSLLGACYENILTLQAAILYLRTR